VETLNGGEIMAKEKEVIKIPDKCCLTCAKLISCCLDSCKKYEKIEFDKESLVGKYLEQLNKVKEAVSSLGCAVNELLFIETEQKVANTVETAKPKEKAEEKPAISKRNKEIVKLAEQGKTIEQIAGELKLEVETVRKEVEYLIKIGILKSIKTENKTNNSKATLKQNEGKVVVLKPA
jgi:hypothetical protein